MVRLTPRRRRPPTATTPPRMREMKEEKRARMRETKERMKMRERARTKREKRRRESKYPHTHHLTPLIQYRNFLQYINVSPSFHSNPPTKISKPFYLSLSILKLSKFNS